MGCSKLGSGCKGLVSVEILVYSETLADRHVAKPNAKTSATTSRKKTLKPTQNSPKPGDTVSRAPLARKWRRTNYFQRLRSGSRNIAGRTFGEAAAAATGQLCFSIRYEILDYKHDQRGGDHG